jgi:hypothetical protein
VTELWGREIVGRDDAASLAVHLSAGGYDGTDLQKVGFVLSGRVMLIEVKVVR